MVSPSFLVVGAGISGLACARSLLDGGARVRVVDRGRAPGGRLAGRRMAGRHVDLGASYVTARPESPFGAVLADWVARGVAREWTDTFAVGDPSGVGGTTSGPMRHGAAAGLRSLAIDLAERLDEDGVRIEQQRTVSAVERAVTGVVVDGEAFDAVVLAMPDPQAARLLPARDSARVRLEQAPTWQPTLAVALRWPERLWSDDLHGVFVNDSDVLGFVADDGDRRGDGAPVLVAHTTPGLARQYLVDPDGAIAPTLRAVRRLLEIEEAPIETLAHRWTFAKPAETFGEDYLLDGAVAVCGDAWSEKSSVGAAWASGHALGRELLAADPVEDDIEDDIDGGEEQDASR